MCGPGESGAAQNMKNSLVPKQGGRNERTKLLVALVYIVSSMHVKGLKDEEYFPLNQYIKGSQPQNSMDKVWQFTGLQCSSSYKYFTLYLRELLCLESNC